MRRRGSGGVDVHAGRSALLAVYMAGRWLAGLFVFVAEIPAGMADGAPPPGLEGKADAVAVLTGGHGRLQAGFALLEQGAAKKLFISGVYDGVAVRELLNLTAKAQDERECCVVLGYAAGDTVGNAAETAEWLEEEGFASLILVTSNYHMPRALVEFEMAAPDARIAPYPIASPNVPIDEWWRRRGTALLLMSEYSKYLVAQARRWLARLLEG